MSIKELPVAAEIEQKDRENLWHHISTYNPDVPPMVITQAEGVWITDIHGNRYLDGMSGLWCVNVGYGRKELAEAAYRQLVTMPYYPLNQSHLPAIQLAEKLNEWLGGDYESSFQTAVRMRMRWHLKLPVNIFNKAVKREDINLFQGTGPIMVTLWGHYPPQASPNENINMNH